MSGERNASGVRRDIQGLRAFAVGLVILDHFGVPGFPGGYIGVDVFFVVSGFLITGLLLREHQRTRRISIPQFYARRARRILPAATVVLVATSLYAAVALPLSRVREVAGDITWSAFFAANWRFASQGTDYFQQGQEPSPVQHFWSLAVEEQFYIVWPALLFLLLLPAVSGRVRVAAVGLIWLASLGYAVWLLEQSATSAYFSSVSRAWELATGALLALVAHRPIAWRPVARWVVGLGGMAAMIGSAMFFDETTAVPGLPALIPTLGTAAVILSAAPTDDRGVVRLIGVRPLVRVGDASYSLYLWHWPIAVLGASALSLPAGVETTLLLALTVVVSVASYRWVEQPFRRGGPLLHGSRALTLWPAALALAVGATTLAQVHAEASLERSKAAARDYYAAHPLEQPDPDLPLTAEILTGQLLAGVEAARDQAPIPPDLLPANPKDQLWNSFYCRAAFESTKMSICPVGDTSSSYTVVALGDSHMGHWLPALDRDGKEHGYRVIPLVKFGCPPYDYPIIWGRGTYDSCEAFRDWSLAQIEQLKPDAVVVGTILAFDRIAVASRAEGVTALEDQSRALLARLRAVTPDVVVVSDLSEAPQTPADCLTGSGNDLGDCLWVQHGDVVTGNQVLVAAAAETGVRYADTSSLVCADGSCPLVAAAHLTYADLGHVSVDWATYVAPVFGQLLGLGPSR